MLLLNSIVIFALCAGTFAAPTPSWRAPIKRSTSSNAKSVAPDAYIVSIKPNTVDPANRGAWLNNVMSAAGVSMTTEQTSSLRLGWNETIMNGIAGTFSAQALEAISSQPEVAFIEPGQCSSIYCSFTPLTPRLFRLPDVHLCSCTAGKCSMGCLSHVDWPGIADGP